MTDNSQDRMKLLEKENLKLRRKLARIENAVERSKRVAASVASAGSMLSFEQKRRDRYMHMLLENSPDMILLFDADLRLSYCTRTFLNRINVSDFNSIIGQSLVDIFRRFADEAWTLDIDAKLRRAFESDNSLKFEETLPFFGIELRIYEILFTPVKDDEPEYNSSVMLFHDITELRKAQEQADEARLVAEQANEAKSIFLSNISHEIRTPMNAIMGMTSIAKTASGITKIGECLDKIEHASIHLSGILNDLLDFSKIEADRLELLSSRFDLGEMIRKVAEIMRPSCDEKRHDLEVRIDEDVPNLLICDEKRLLQVIMNLLSNAIKFTPDTGKIGLFVKCAEKENGICTLLFEVADNGIGISEEQQRRLFASFEQIDSGTSRKFGGTGLGLVIAKRIVDMMNGEIWLESELGKGAKFFFALTVEYAESDANANFKDASLESADGADAGSKGSGGKDASGAGSKDMSGADCKDASGKDASGVSKQAGQDAHGESAGSADCKDASGKDASCVSKQAGQDASGDRIFEHCRALLAEDIEINREIVHAFTESTGLQITDARNGKEALEIFENDPDAFDIVFMDLQMPEMDGYNTTRAIRSLGSVKAKQIPIIAMTANVFREDVEKCLAVGMNDHIGKPINSDKLLDTLRKYLG